MPQRRLSEEPDFIVGRYQQAHPWPVAADGGGHSLVLKNTNFKSYKNKKATFPTAPKDEKAEVKRAQRAPAPGSHNVQSHHYHTGNFSAVQCAFSKAK